MCTAAAAAAKSLQSCPTLCNPIDGSPPGSPIPGILQARTLEWVAISFSNVWKWKVKVKSLSHVRLFATPRTAAYQALPPMGFSRQEYWSGVPLPSPTCVQPPPSTLTHHNHPKSIVYIRVHSWCHALYRFGQMYNDMYPSLLLLLFSRSVMSNSLLPHGLQHARLPCPSLFPRVCANSCPLSWWCHPIILSSVVPFSSCP